MPVLGVRDVAPMRRFRHPTVLPSPAQVTPCRLARHPRDEEPAGRTVTVRCGDPGRRTPGDIARRGVARRAERGQSGSVRGNGSSGGTTEAASKGTGPRSRSARTSPTGSPRERRSPVGPANTDRESRAQDLRDLLAGAFQLPPTWPRHRPPTPIPPTPVRRRTPGAATRGPVNPRTPGRSDTGGTEPSPESPDPGPSPPTLSPGPPPRPLPSFTPRPRTRSPAPSALRRPSRSTRGNTGAAAHPAPTTAAAAPRRPKPPGTGPGPCRAAPLHGIPRPRRRVAPYLPRPSPRGSADGTEAFAETWWGNAWVSALEEGALDAARLARGADVCRAGACRRHHRHPGAGARLCARQPPAAVPRPGAAADPRRRRLGPFPGRGRRAARTHRRAARQGDAPGRSPTAESPLLPGPGDLDPHCSCPDFGHPCKHAAALCYQTARLLDADPFVLLLLRGRGERELLDALSRRNAARAARAAQEQEPAPLPGVRARDALARRALPPLPARCRRPRTPSSRRPTRARRAARTRSRWTSWPRTRPPAPTRCSPRAATRSRN